MANKALESTVLSIEVQSGSDKDGNPTPSYIILQFEIIQLHRNF